MRKTIEEQAKHDTEQAIRASRFLNQAFDHLFGGANERGHGTDSATLKQTKARSEQKSAPVNVVNRNGEG